MTDTPHQTIRLDCNLAQRELQLTKELADTTLSTQLDSQRLTSLVQWRSKITSKICFDPEDEEEIDTISRAGGLDCLQVV